MSDELFDETAAELVRQMEQLDQWESVTIRGPAVILILRREDKHELRGTGTFHQVFESLNDDAQTALRALLDALGDSCAYPETGE